MLVCLNDPRNRIRVPLSLDLLSEIDRITSRQAKSERVSLGFHGGGVYWCPSGPATEPGKGKMGNVSFRIFLDDD